MTFEPVAVVGQAGLLPGAHSPEELWELIVRGGVALGPAPATRWRADRERMLSSGACVTDQCGFVEGFEKIWRPADYGMDEAILADLDPVFQWLLHVGRRALTDAALAPGLRPRTGAIVGNLGYPTEALIDLAQAAYLSDKPHRRRGKLNRFSTGYPVQLMCETLGLAAGGFALDAACASSLYAMRLACDWLHEGRADCMLAGGISRCDPLLIQSGFTALRALSPTGQSRPFHRDADGLVPAEGAALLVLKRLADAEAAGDRILGVIRGIGLSNDGRSGGMLSPAAEGQIRAMQSAYAQAGLSPREISFVECHATGTQVGDAVELRSMAEVFRDAEDLAIGSLKANLGHLITASGAAGVIKVLAAMKHGVRPGSPNSMPLTGAADGTPFRILNAAEPWPRTDAPRRAAISSFGFGGNNAHVVMEEYVPGTRYPAATRPERDRIVVVTMAAQAGNGNGTRDFVRDLFTGDRAVQENLTETHVGSAGLAFPPRDLERALGQQTLMLQVAREALASVQRLPAERTAVLTGIACDPNASRGTLQLAFPDASGLLNDPLDAARVMGCMPNLTANRLNRQHSFGGPGFSIFGEEDSGLRALETAAEWLHQREIDAAVVGAVDLAAEDVTSTASGERTADGAAVLVLKREADAMRDGDNVFAVANAANLDFRPKVKATFGNTHAASGLLAVAADIASANRARYLEAGVRRFRARSLHALIEAVSHGVNPDEGDHRLALITADDTRIIDFLHSGARGPRPEGVFYRTEPLTGEVAFVFTGAAAAYAGMSRELVAAFPELPQAVSERCPRSHEYAAWIYADHPAAPSDFQQLCGSSFLSQIHAEFTLRILGLKPAAAIGLSSGETNALYALGAWSGMGEFMAQLEDCGLYTRVLAGEAAAVHESWRARGVAGRRWSHYRISAGREDLDAALSNEPAVHITIVNAPEDFVIGGEELACERVVSRLKRGHAAPLSMELAVHCEDLRPAADLWRSLHTRPTAAVPGVRFYSNALGHAYELSAASIADALTAQALATVDFPRTVKRAWDDGVRIFIEHGPRNQCTQSIRSILGDLPHVAVSLDVAGRSSLRQGMYAAAELWTAGLDVDLRRFAAAALPEKGDLVFPAHHAAAILREPAVQVLAAAPALAPLIQTTEPEPAPRANAAVEMHARLSESHRIYMEEMLRLEEAFLRTEQNLLSTLAGRPKKEKLAPGRSFSRQDLEHLAAQRISDIFGPAFAAQDDYARQVRMPEPPMLLADRVVNLTGEPNSMGSGSIVTETDVTPDAWYLHQGYMPAGIAIESGQADLLLISWLGADRLNKGERVYRLLGCDLTFHGSLPRAGETLSYEIHVDSHAQSGGIRMFFFHYDCTVAGKPRLSVRDGQAGFFSDEELAASEGVLWSADKGEHTPADKARLDAPLRLTHLRAFDAGHMEALADGRLADCFGEGFEKAKVHTRSPRIPAGRLRMLQNISAFDPNGGPWGRGYLRAEWHFSPGDWFFAGHFRNDPCMPGTLMFEGCMQAMAVYLSALGFTIERDGWRFEPVAEQMYPLRCRGQAVPSSKLLVYEVFVDEIVGGNEPALFADVLCTVDGLKAFHCRRLGVRLTPDWPLEEQRAELSALPEPKPVAVIDGFAYGWTSLLACAVGRPSDAFGERFARFDGPIRTPRLPAPPYHFISRVTRAEHGSGGAVGSSCEVEYDVPPDAWYFKGNAGVMPACVFLEALLQPCGWLASFAGTWLNISSDIFFRNLDGNGRILGEIGPDTGTLTTQLTLTSFSELAGMSIYAFALVCSAGDLPLFEGTAVFGNFPAGALERQAGIPASPGELEWFALPAAETPLELESPVRMIDRITGYWPEGGAAGLGRMRAEKDLDPGQWFFKAHFFNDPVQPGSLGIEAMIQTLQALMIRQRLDRGIANPGFEAVATGEPISWAYRGQVTPDKKRITALVEILEAAPGFARAAASLWVDGKKIYAMPGLALRIVPGTASSIETLDPAHDRWLSDHCPTYTVPALPMMSVADRLATARQRHARGKLVTEIQDLTLDGWISFASGARQVKTEVEEDAVTLSVWRDAPRAEMSRFEPIARATVYISDQYPAPPAPLAPLRAEQVEQDPYESGELFHGPAFRVISRLRRSTEGASFLLNAGSSAAPRGLLNQILLDGATHGIPNDRLSLWSNRIPTGMVGYPARIKRLTLFGPAPIEGQVRCEVRIAGFEGEAPRFAIQWIVRETVWASCDLLYALLPKGPIGSASAIDRRAFLRGRVYVPGLGLGRFDGAATEVNNRDVAESDWLAGTLRSAYALKTADPTAEIAAKQHVARALALHPAEIDVADDFCTATAQRYPLTKFNLTVQRDSTGAIVRTASSWLDVETVRQFWNRFLGIDDWPITTLNLALIARFIRRVELRDPARFRALEGQPAIYVANHQVAVESLLFNALMVALTGVRVRIVAKKEHRESWIGQLMHFAATFPGIRPLNPILFFDREDPAALETLLSEFRHELDSEPVSLMVHVEGTRARSSREPVTRVGSVFPDLAVELGLPIVPVRFAGGLPVKPLPERLEFPFNGGQQDIVIGQAIPATALRGLPLKQRATVVIDALEALRDTAEEPLPRPAVWPELPPDPRTVLLQTLRIGGFNWNNLPPGAEASAWLSNFADWLGDSR